MEIYSGTIAGARRIAILPGAFDPPTVAHIGLANAALDYADVVLLTMPREYPHKSFDETTLEERLALLSLVSQGSSRFAVAVSEGGLFLDMARELKEIAGPIDPPYLVCGRDAAERIVDWNYGAAPGILEQLREYRLLVASRGGRFEPPRAITPYLDFIEASWDEVSSTAVREAMRAGRDWRPLAPEAIHEAVDRIYSRSRLDSRNARSR